MLYKIVGGIKAKKLKVSVEFAFALLKTTNKSLSVRLICAQKTSDAFLPKYVQKKDKKS